MHPAEPSLSIQFRAGIEQHSSTKLKTDVNLFALNGRMQSLLAQQGTRTQTTLCVREERLCPEYSALGLLGYTQTAHEHVHISASLFRSTSTLSKLFTMRR